MRGSWQLVIPFVRVSPGLRRDIISSNHAQELPIHGSHLLVTDLHSCQMSLKGFQA